MHKIHNQNSIISSQYLSNFTVQSYLMPQKRLNKLVKQQIIQPDIIQANSALKQYLKAEFPMKQSNNLIKYLDKQKLSQYEKVQIHNNKFNNQAEIILVSTSLDRLGQKQLAQIIKLKKSS